MSSGVVKKEAEIALSSAGDVVLQLNEEQKKNETTEGVKEAEKGKSKEEEADEQDKEDGEDVDEDDEEEDDDEEEEEEEDDDVTPTPQPPQLPPKNNLSLSDIIIDAANDAVKYKDYMSYATVLEELMENPSRYTDDQKQEILEAILQVIEENDELVVEIGWDLPIPILQYIETTYNFETDLISNIHVRLVMRIFTVLCEKGNPKELFLKGVEALSSLKVYSEDDPDNSDRVEKYADMKFYLAFELMFFSLRRIDVQFPSRFLATAITVSLSFLASNLENLTILSLGVILRRLFTFARDYETGVDINNVDSPPQPTREFSQSEIEVQQKLLQSFITWVSDFTFQRFSVQWAQRFYYELKTGVAFDETKHNRPYELHLHTERVTECIERLSQLSYSFDMDIIQLLKDVVNKEEEEVVDEDEDEEQKPSPFSNLSDEGVFLLATQIRFDYRNHNDKDITFSELVKLIVRFYRKSVAAGTNTPLGIQDASLFWGLYLTRNTTQEEIRSIPQEEFSAYLQSLMVLSATSTDKESRFIAYSLTAKLLGLHTPKVSFDFILDTLKYCPFENVKDATVRILKTLSLPKKPTNIASPAFRRASTSVDGLSEGVGSLSIAGEESQDAFITLDKEKISVIEELIEQNLEEVNETGGIFSDSLPVLLSWINFITVVETDKKFLTKFVEQVSNLVNSSSKNLPEETEKCKESCRQRQGFLTLSIESVKKRWLD